MHLKIKDAFGDSEKIQDMEKKLNELDTIANKTEEACENRNIDHKLKNI